MTKKVNFNFYKNNGKLDCLKMLMFISYRITYISNQVRDQYIPGFSCVNISQLFNPFPSVKNAPSYYSHQIIIKKSLSLFEICFLLNEKNVWSQKISTRKKICSTKKKKSTRKKEVPGKQKTQCQKGNQKEMEMSLVIYFVKNFDRDKN